MAAKKRSTRRRTASGKSNTRRKPDTKRASSAWNEPVAIILMGSGLLYFLAIISYTPADLPSWVKFSRAAADHTAVAALRRRRALAMDWPRHRRRGAHGRRGGHPHLVGAQA